MVSLGAVLIANDSWFSRVSWFEASASTNAARSRTRCGSCCSQTVPMSLTIEASTTGSLPACSMPATDTHTPPTLCASAQRVGAGDEGVGKPHLVGFELAGNLADRVDHDARRFHVDQKLGQAVAAGFLGGWRGAKNRGHVIGGGR